MWFNSAKMTEKAIQSYRHSLLTSCPNYVVIDGLFNDSMLSQVSHRLQQSTNWQTQQHTYAKLYVDPSQWQNTCNEERFVQRDVWLRSPTPIVTGETTTDIRQAFLNFLRGDEFLSFLSQLFHVVITDINVEDPSINSNYFRLSSDDFIAQHADDSPGREVCMLLYLNREWDERAGGELTFLGKDEKNISISPIFNRCILFNPSSEGSEHWVKSLNKQYANHYRYNVTSWYWRE